jgi:asparagine synthase (glutamine-hydrolysing)
VEVLHLLEKHVKNKKDNSRKIRTIFVFMVWHQICIENFYDFNDSHEMDAIQKSQAAS